MKTLLTAALIALTLPAFAADAPAGKVLTDQGKVFSNNHGAVVRKTLKNGEKIDKHNHEGEDIIFNVMSGKITVILNDSEKHELQAGDFFLLTAGSQHTIYAGEGDSAISGDRKNGLLQLCNEGDGEPLRMLCGTYQVRNRAATALLAILPEPLRVSLGDIPQLPALCTLIHDEALTRREGSVTIIRTLCEILLLLALRHVSDLPQQHHLTALFSDPGLARVLEHILANPFAPCTTEDLAEIACMSRATFARKFQQAVGSGVQTFIRALKMSAAAKMLRDSNRAVSRVAEETGYQSEAAFNNAFKAQFGITPARYRRQSENDENRDA